MAWIAADEPLLEVEVDNLVIVGFSLLCCSTARLTSAGLIGSIEKSSILASNQALDGTSSVSALVPLPTPGNNVGFAGFIVSGPVALEA